MEIMFLFALAWIAGQFAGDKTDEYQRSQAHVRKQVNAAHPHATKERRDRMVRNSARRNTLGFAAYQMRHGWPDLWGSIWTGWTDARRGHEEWRRQREEAGEGRPSVKETARAGWRGGWRPRRNETTEPAAEATPASGATPETKPKPAAEQPKPATTGSAGPEGGPGGGAKPADTDPVVMPFRRPGSTSTPATSRGASTMSGTSGEAGGYTGAHSVTDTVSADITNLASSLEQYEADLMAGGATNDPQIASTLAQMREHTNALLAALQAHKAALSGHEGGHEYAAGKGAGAANTSWLGAG